MAPTIFIIPGNIKIRIYPKDHRPAHVHVVAPEADAKFDIKTGECVANEGFDQTTIKMLSRFVLVKKELLMEKWHEFEGEEN